MFMENLIILFLKKISIGYFEDVKIDEIDMKILIDKWNITEVKERAIRKNLKKIVFYKRCSKYLLRF